MPFMKALFKAEAAGDANAAAMADWMRHIFLERAQPMPRRNRRHSQHRHSRAQAQRVLPRSSLPGTASTTALAAAKDAR